MLWGLLCFLRLPPPPAPPRSETFSPPLHNWMHKLNFLLTILGLRIFRLSLEINWCRDPSSPDGDCWFLGRPDLLQVYRKIYLKFCCERNRIYIDTQISVFFQLNWKLTFHPRDYKKTFLECRSMSRVMQVWMCTAKYCILQKKNFCRLCCCVVHLTKNIY